MTTDDVSALLEQGVRMCQVGAFDSAEKHYRDLVVSHPEAPDAWNMLAIVLQQQGALEEAEQAASRATELRPQIPPYWLTRGNVAMARRHHEEARTSFRRALEIEPRFAPVHYRLGLSYHRDLRYTDAIAAYREALRYVPDVAEIHCQLADALVSMAMPKEAIRAYQEAFVRDPQGELDRRGCFELMDLWHFDALPEFWNAEIARFFERQDVDKTPYVRLALRVLKNRRHFRAVLEHSEAPDAASAWDPSALREVENDRLFLVLLRDCLIPDPRFERFLTRLRAHLLFDEGARSRTAIDFLSVFALQCSTNEFVYAESESESAAASHLARDIEAALRSGAPVQDQTIRALAVLGTYRPLHEVPGIDALLARPGDGSMLDQLLQRSVRDVRTERSLRAEIPAIGEITDAVSCAVRDMYEQHPYPRWFFLDREQPVPLAEWLERELPAQPSIAVPASARILVAGCGTGKDAIWLASNIAGSDVLGIDLSSSSLAHAQRMANEMNVANVRFRHGDILGLDSITDRFDLIASTGVLHHMRDPQTGLRALLRLLSPGGLLKIGLYSATARRSVSAARDVIAQQQLAPAEPDIRKFRQSVFAAGENSSLKELEVSNDFYSMSMCRDLLFHIQEHQFRIPHIAAMFEALGLELLGLSELPRHIVADYRRMFPDDPLMASFANWDAFEKQFPNTFSGMYLLWCRKCVPSD